MRRNLNPTIIIIIAMLLLEGPIRALRYGGPGALTAWIMDTVLILPAIIIALSFHEFGHAKAAQLCGDDTPLHQGRVTLDPRAHIDPMGLVALIFIHFGWGKPVMINPHNFKNRRRDGIIVGLAGVFMNLVIAISFGLILKLLHVLSPAFFETALGMNTGHVIVKIVIINIALMLFNLLPIPPLDGFGVLTEIFNLYGTRFHKFVTRYSFMILMFFILFNIPGRLLSLPMVRITNFILSTVCKVPAWYIFL